MYERKYGKSPLDPENHKPFSETALGENSTGSTGAGGWGFAVNKETTHRIEYDSTKDDEVGLSRLTSRATGQTATTGKSGKSSSIVDTVLNGVATFATKISEKSSSGTSKVLKGLGRKSGS
jgi:hypothetical protein